MHNRFMRIAVATGLIFTLTACGNKKQSETLPDMVNENTENIVQKAVVEETFSEEATEDLEKETQTTKYALITTEDDVNPHSGYYRDRIVWSSNFINDDLNMYEADSINWSVVTSRYGWEIEGIDAEGNKTSIAGYKEEIVDHRKDFGNEIVFEDYIDNRKGSIKDADDGVYEPDKYAKSIIKEWSNHKSGLQKTEKYFFETDLYTTEENVLLMVSVYDNDPTEMLEEYGGDAVSFAAHIWMIIDNETPGWQVSDNLYEYIMTVLKDSLGYEDFDRIDLLGAVK